MTGRASPNGKQNYGNHCTNKLRCRVLPPVYKRNYFCMQANALLVVVILVSRCLFAMTSEFSSTIRYSPNGGLSSIASTRATSEGYTYTTPTSTSSQRYSIHTSQSSSLIPTPQLHATSLTTTTATNAANSDIVYNNIVNGQQQQQPKSLKFTLIAGKYWKFNIKTNSLQTRHKEKELRLHRNISSNSFIIDDDNWFQYNHQQQQLFAWPGLSTKATTYYFVLLPSGLDFEAEGEYVVNNADIVANIVVELIKPVNVGNLRDFDQMIDYKFSLELLQRSSAYPLLLSQIVSILESLAKASSNNVSASAQTTATSSQATPLTTSRSISSQVQQQQGTNNKFIARSSNKLSEYLLIDFNASTDGELFSLTWTTHHSLINNTITLISECRLEAIQDIVTKLSSSSLAYQNGIDKFVIFYALESSLTNSQALVPAEHDNFALKLILNGSCKKKKILEELVGLTPYANDNRGEGNSTFDLDVTSLPSTKSSGTVTSSTESSASSLIVPVHQLGQSAIIHSQTTTEQTPQSTSRVIASTTKSPTVTRTPSRRVQSTKSPLQSEGLPLHLSDRSQLLTQPSTTAITAPTTSGSSASNKISLTSVATITTAAQISTADQQHRAALDAQVLVSRSPPIGQQQQLQSQQTNKIQPQAKSFANYIGAPDVRVLNLTMEEAKNLPTTPSTDNLGETSTNIISIKKSTPSSVSTTTLNSAIQETTLHEDLIGILNESFDYLISIAVPASIVIGCILLISIIVALCHLHAKRKKSRQFQVGNRFKYRYGSERRGFLKNSSKPVILEADQKSLSMGGTPQHRPKKNCEKESDKQKGTYLKMKPMKNGKPNGGGDVSSGSGFFSASNLVNSHVVNMSSENGEGSSFGSRNNGM